jgi:phage-related protein
LYGGTKDEMARLIDDANEYERAQGRAGDLVMDSFADQIRAIHDIQEQLGVTGTTSREAATTIQGAASMAKAAWENWLVGIAADDADVGQLTQQLLDAIGTFADNAVPRVLTIFDRVAENLPAVMERVGQTLVPLLTKVLGQVWDTASRTLSKVGIQLPELDTGKVVSVVTQVAEALAGLARAAGPVVTAALSALAGALGWVADNLGWIGPVATGVLTSIMAFQAVSAVTGAITALSSAFGLLVSAMGMIQSIQGVGAVLATLAGGPVTAIIAAIAGVVAVLVYLWNTNEGFRDSVLGAWDAITGAVQSFASGVVELATVTVPGAVAGVAGLLASIPESVAGALSQAAESVSSLVGGAIDAVASVPGAVTAALAQVPQAFADAFGAATEPARRAADAIGEAVSGLPGRIRDWLASIPQAFADMFSQVHVPTLHVEGGFSLDPANFRLPEIKFYGSGGYVSSPTLAMVGERGGELVWPSYGGYLDRYARAIAERMPERSGGTTINMGGVVVRETADVGRIMEEMELRVSRAERAGAHG